MTTIPAQDCIVLLPLISYLTLITNRQSLRNNWGGLGNKGNKRKLEAVCWILPWTVPWNRTFSVHPVPCFHLTALLRKKGRSCRPDVVEVLVFSAVWVTEVLGTVIWCMPLFCFEFSCHLTLLIKHQSAVKDNRCVFRWTCYLEWSVCVCIVLGHLPCSPGNKNYSSNHVWSVSEHVSLRGANAVRAWSTRVPACVRHEPVWCRWLRESEWSCGNFTTAKT